MENGFEQATAFGLGRGELHFKLVAEGHHFIHFGDNASLFFEWWDRELAFLADEVVTRLAIMNTATAIRASGSRAVSLPDVIALAGQLEAWATR